MNLRTIASEGIYIGIGRLDIVNIIMGHKNATQVYDIMLLSVLGKCLWFKLLKPQLPHLVTELHGGSCRAVPLARPSDFNQTDHQNFAESRPPFCSSCTALRRYHISFSTESA